MTFLSDYSPEQALARDLLITALNGGASVYWAHVHGVTVDCPPDQVRAEGIDLSDRSVWSVDLADITHAVTKLIEHPPSCGDPDYISDTGILTCVSGSLAAARNRRLTTVADVPAIDAASDYDRPEFEQLIADVVFQVAVAGEVIR